MLLLHGLMCRLWQLGLVDLWLWISLAFVLSGLLGSLLYILLIRVIAVLLKIVIGFLLNLLTYKGLWLHYRLLHARLYYLLGCQRLEVHVALLQLPLVNS